MCLCGNFFSVKDFSGTTAPRILKLVTNIGYDLYCVSQNQRARAYHSLYLSILAHLELCPVSANAIACCPLSVCRPLLAFHILKISSRTISWIELKHSGRHCGNMEIQNC